MAPAAVRQEACSIKPTSISVPGSNGEEPSKMTRRQVSRNAGTMLLAFVIGSGITLASQVTFPSTFPFVANSPIRASEVNATFVAVKTAVDDNDARLAAIESPPLYAAPSFAPGWGNVGGAYALAGYNKDRSGIVRLRGLVRRTVPTANASDFVIFTLPVGFRPAARLAFPARCGDGSLCFIEVFATGEVRYDGPGGIGSPAPNGSLTLDGISFDLR